MTEYTIAFDFPETDEPIFAGWLPKGGLGWAPTLKTAARFDTELEAEQTRQMYPAAARDFGAVVEIGGPS